MTELSKTRWGVWFRFGCGFVALLLAVIPELDQTRRLFHITGHWDQPSNYFFAAIAVALLGLLGSHWAMKPGALTVQRGIGVAICIVALLLAACALVLSGVMSIGMGL